jgi:hypothetical protein
MTLKAVVLSASLFLIAIIPTRAEQPTTKDVPVSEDAQWRAHVEVDVSSEGGCKHTTQLWISGPDGLKRMEYMIPPKRTASGNGMEVLGWATKSSLLLVKTLEWQLGSDAEPTEQVLAIDAKTGMVYKRNWMRCSSRVKVSSVRIELIMLDSVPEKA